MELSAKLRSFVEACARASLFLLRGLQQQILIVEAEISQRRDRRHARAVDRAVRLQRESNKCVLDGVIAPVRLESVMLPVLQVADHRRSVVEGDDEATVFPADGNGTVPSVVVSS